MKTMIVCERKDVALAVYAQEQRKRLASLSDIYPEVVSADDLRKDPSVASGVECIFSTWGMPDGFTEEDIHRFFPSLKAVFYAAGTVQSFARPFLKCGIKVSSAWVANSIPVAEFTFAQIILALKGYFSSVDRPKKVVPYPEGFSKHCKGSYRAKVGICGIGAVGTIVCERLKSTDCEVYAYDKFITPERTAALGVTMASLEEIFGTCDVISNHLANKPELQRLYTYDLFSRMKPWSTFINTGRGAQVDENGLAQAMAEDPSRTALLDVTFPEPMQENSPLASCSNILVTPHIAGSIGNERCRMADWMIDEFLRLREGEALQYAVTLPMLETMA